MFYYLILEDGFREFNEDVLDRMESSKRDGFQVTDTQKVHLRTGSGSSIVELPNSSDTSLLGCKITLR